ncbi:MAG TPA: hypothetical protein DDW55_06385 [Gammaproteobacteria bacterium]|nr:hypothetical protein [Gammaproteobacteria bacterium]
MFTELLNQDHLKAINSAAAINDRDAVLDIARMLNELTYYAADADSEPSLDLLAEAATMAGDMLSLAGRLEILLETNRMAA